MPFMQAITGRNHTGTIPAWFMRQAGRYLPEYRTIRSSHTLSHMFHDEELIIKITKLPLQEFPIDAAIVFSDILLVLESLGCKVNYIDGVGPQVEVARDREGYPLFDTEHSIREHFTFLDSAIRGLKRDIDVPLIGFVGGPYTVLSYLFKNRVIPNNQKKIESLLQKIVIKTQELATLQVNAGIDAFQIFDTWAGHLPDDLYNTYSLNPCSQIKAGVPTLYFSLNAGKRALHILKTVKPEGVSVGELDSLSELRSVVGDSIILQGNLDPHLVLQSQEKALDQVKRIKQEMQNDPSFIFNFSHGVLPKTPVDNIRAVLEELKK